MSRKNLIKKALERFVGKTFVAEGESELELLLEKKLNEVVQEIDDSCSVHDVMVYPDSLYVVVWCEGEDFEDIYVEFDALEEVRFSIRGVKNEE
jgi:hypothetical protein